MLNREKYERDIENLINEADGFLLEDDTSFSFLGERYEEWYSEALSLVKVILPDRVEDFKKYYHSEENSLRGYFSDITLVYSGDSAFISETDYARKLLQNQLGIVKAAKRRFETSLFDIRNYLQADLFDSELEKSKFLLKNGFLRASGVIAGVVLEGHLKDVCENRNLKIGKKNPAISDYNNYLKETNVIDQAKWRFITYLADLRNKCSHKKDDSLSKDEIKKLIEGVNEIIKTIA